jgi:RNA polymerase sigma-70 factor, ECF subfamily
MQIFQIDEKDLVLGIKAQQQGKFTILYKNYAKSLKNNISRYIKNETDTENILQETFIKIWLNIDKFDAQKGKLFTWMMNLSKNTAIDFLRAKRRQYEANEISIDYMTDYFVYENNTAGQLEYIGFNQIIDLLEPKQKQVIDLHYFMGYSHQQTAEYLNIPEGTVKTRISRALKQLKIYLNKEFQNESNNK